MQAERRFSLPYFLLKQSNIYTNPTPSALAGGLSLSLPAKAVKSLSHRFPSVARHRIYPTHLNTVRNDSGASFLRNGISSQGQGQILLQVAPENINHIQRTDRILKNIAPFLPREKKKKKSGTYSSSHSKYLSFSARKASG